MVEQDIPEGLKPLLSDGVLFYGEWGRLFFASNSPLAYFNMDDATRVTLINDEVFGRYFLQDIEPRCQRDSIMHDLYRYANPWNPKLRHFTEQDVILGLLKLFQRDELRVWQITDGWARPPEHIGSGASSAADDTPTQDSATALAPKIRTSTPGGRATATEIPQTTMATHNPTPIKAEPKGIDAIAKDSAARKALYKKHGIEVGPYKELQKIKKLGYQREHFIPHSCFMVRSVAKGESRSKVPLGSRYGDYNEGDAITYFVYDAQSEGTEHRTLTDAERTLAKDLDKQGEFATVTEWLDHMEQETARTFILEHVERAPGVYEARVPANEAALVAKCIRTDVELYLKGCGCDMNAPLSNLVGGGGVPDIGDVVDEDF